MPTAIVHHEVSGERGRPAVVLCNSLGTNLSLWEPQVAALAERFQVIRYDARGHGRSPVEPGPYTIEDLSGDVVALLDHLGIPRAHVVGISIGGLTAQHLAIAHPDRLDRLVAANTAPMIGEPAAWRERAVLVTASGMSAVSGTVVERWLTPEYAAAHPETARRLLDMVDATDPAGYAASCAVFATTDLTSRLSEIAAPTLAIGATHDVLTPPAATRSIAESVRRGEYHELTAAHISNVEAAPEFTRLVQSFLTAS